MKNAFLLILAFACMLSLHAQHSYELNAPLQQQPVRSGHLQLGGTSPAGGSIAVNSCYMSVDGRPVIPVMGEFHYARYPEQQWEEEILKMKAGGVTVLSSYIFWALHEEEEGHFRWDGQLDLRHFLLLCKQHDLPVVIRIGPFCHAEIRNGGLPDWLFAKPLEVRSNDPEYLRLVGRFYTEIARQADGLYYKDGGPIIGCQIENEMQHSAAPWAIHYPQEPFDFAAASYNAGEASIGVEVQEKTASDPEMGEQHMRTLKQMATDAGIVTPLYTATGWGNAAVIGYEALPVTAAYTYPFWEAEPTMSPFLLFKDLHQEPDYAPVRYNPADYPSFSVEMGAGIQMIYASRPIVTAEAAEGLMVRSLGSGANGIGYYMYHGGSTPKMQDGVGSFQDEPMGMPKVSYDFQAPLGEFGLEGKMYRNLRLLHTFLADFGDRLAPMQTVLPDGWQQLTPDNRDDLRFCARMKDGAGFLFMINFQDHDTLRHDQQGLQLKLNLGDEQLTIPQTGTLTLGRDQSVILPFNFEMEAGIRLKYATAQLLCRIDDGGTPHYFFFAPQKMQPEYVFDATTVRGRNRYTPSAAGFSSTFTVKANDGSRVRITTLTRQQALNTLKLDGRLLITDASVLPADHGATLLSLGRNTIEYVVYPSSHGFRTQTISVPTVSAEADVRRAGLRRMSVSLPQLDTEAPQVQEYFLRIHYTGDVAMAFLRGQLVQDEFFHGAPWTIGLKRYYTALADSLPLTFYFRPLQPDAPFLRDLPATSIPDFSEGPVVRIGDVEVIPEYRADIRF